jgi:hypothetical protein
MDSLGAAGMSAFSNDPKTQVMRQVQQEAAMQNARMLVEVRLDYTSTKLPDNITCFIHNC